MLNLRQIPVGQVLQDMRIVDRDGSMYSPYPTMALCTLGCLTSESFVERMGSAAKKVMSADRTSLGDDLFEQLTLLRMNSGLFTNH